MYENPEKIALALYFGTKKVSRDGEFIYKPFPTLYHIQHEAFIFAVKYNFLNAYGYTKGEYMPVSERVDKGIIDNFVYNPVFDNYEANISYDKEFDIWLEKNKEYKRELEAIRNRCEIYTAPELYLVLYENESPYIKNIKKRDSNPHVYRNQINKTLGSMRYEWFKEIKITEDKYEKMRSMFDKII